jgi:hypothetical protein
LNNGEIGLCTQGKPEGEDERKNGCFHGFN